MHVSLKDQHCQTRQNIKTSLYAINEAYLKWKVAERLKLLKELKTVNNNKTRLI